MGAIVFGFMLLVGIYILYKLFIDGWLFKIPIFFAGWIGMILILKALGVRDVAFTLENGTQIGVATVISTVICLLALVTTRVSND
jgi:hypothetical protein